MPGCYRSSRFGIDCYGMAELLAHANVIVAQGPIPGAAKTGGGELSRQQQRFSTGSGSVMTNINTVILETIAPVLAPVLVQATGGLAGGSQSGQ